MSSSWVGVGPVQVVALSPARAGATPARAARGWAPPLRRTRRAFGLGAAADLDVAVGELHPAPLDVDALRPVGDPRPACNGGGLPGTDRGERPRAVGWIPD